MICGSSNCRMGVVLTTWKPVGPCHAPDRPCKGVLCTLLSGVRYLPTLPFPVFPYPLTSKMDSTSSQGGAEQRCSHCCTNRGVWKGWSWECPPDFQHPVHITQCSPKHGWGQCAIAGALSRPMQAPFNARSTGCRGSARNGSQLVARVGENRTRWAWGG